MSVITKTVPLHVKDELKHLDHGLLSCDTTAFGLVGGYQCFTGT
jgi:hypothetical protein